MNITTEDIDGGVIAHVNEARLDAAIAMRFKDRLREVVTWHGPRVVLDLSAVTFMDSSGLGAILAIRRALPSNHRIELRGLTPNVDRVFRLTRMDMIFTIHSGPPVGMADALARPEPEPGVQP